MPFGVILDTDVCLDAPEILWHSGVGDLISKFTAVADWKNGLFTPSALRSMISPLCSPMPASTGY
jgi:glycerol dehydrogenase-like iron-containing ADH family enzyme